MVTLILTVLSFKNKLLDISVWWFIHLMHNYARNMIWVMDVKKKL